MGRSQRGENVSGAPAGRTVAFEAPLTRTVAFVDDHEAVTLALGLLVSDQAELRHVGSAKTVTELLNRQLEPDLVVLDLRLGDGSTLAENIARLRWAGSQVLALTSGENPYLLRTAARSDVLGIVRKSAPQSEIIEAIVQASDGVFVSTTDWAAAIDGDPDLDRVRLTDRERQVLELYAVGGSSGEVARELGISSHTVESHLKHIRSQYAGLRRNSSTRLDLYRRAVEDGFLPLPGHVR